VTKASPDSTPTKTSPASTSTEKKNKTSSLLGKQTASQEKATLHTASELQDVAKTDEEMAQTLQAQFDLENELAENKSNPHTPKPINKPAAKNGKRRKDSDEDSDTNSNVDWGGLMKNPKKKIKKI